ncbi:MAG: putative molybdenum cofactor biosynthesis protein [Phycisphaerales bacterium]|nr:putative molybdenum cofactor biosynthesis protein [Phycisphaerales bacterium]
MNETPLWANERLRLIITGQCNINCFYCHNEGQPKNDAFMSEELFVHVLKLIASNDSPLSNVTFSGGEPLLHPGLESFIERVVNNAARRTVVTNGLLLSPARLRSLIDSGVTKFRLGVDSLTQQKSRPTPGHKPERPITEVISMVKDSGVDFELNVVLTHFNTRELSTIFQFCKENRLSAKFFEHVKVHALTIHRSETHIISQPLVPLENFLNIASSVFKESRFAPDPKLGDANFVLTDGNIELRYCRYLCDYALCGMTGTRIDSRGFAYACMEGDGEYKIDAGEALYQSLDTIRTAVRQGCHRSRPVAASSDLRR